MIGTTRAEGDGTMKKLRFGVPVCAIAAIGVAFACGTSSDDNIIVDASSDTTTDVKTDAKTDSGVDTGVDAKADSAADAGSDASDAEVDATSDAPSDAGIDVIVVDAGDSGTTCGSKQGFGYVSIGDAGVCGIGEDYTCGLDGYEILCECPAAACTCYKNKNDAGSVAYGGCPTCSTPSFSTIASACGIPY